MSETRTHRAVEYGRLFIRGALRLETAVITLAATSFILLALIVLVFARLAEQSLITATEAAELSYAIDITSYLLLVPLLAGAYQLVKGVLFS